MEELDEKLCICGQPRKQSRDKLNKFCSMKCANKHTSQKHSPFKNPEVQKKIKQKWLDEYGVTNPGSRQEVKDKIAKTNIERYGGIAPAFSKEVQEKAKQTNLEKYGVEYYSQTDKARQCLIDWNQRNIPKEILDKTYNKEFLLYQHKVLRKTISEIAKDLGVSITLIWERFIELGIETNHYFSISKEESDVEDFIKTLNINYERNTRSVILPKELDFYFPDHKIAIEYNGVYYHTTEYISPDHHSDKTKACKEKSIRLFHIFSHQWLEKSEIVKSMISGLFGRYDRKIHARKCNIIEVTDMKVNQKFLDDNHIQGSVQSSINLGLYYEEELVALMAFSKCRFHKGYEYELVRFCSSLNTQVIGGASKLLTHFEKSYNPKSIVSYADLTYSYGNVYNKLGFTLKHITKPNYSYYKNGLVESRQKYQKKYLPKKLENYDPTLTEEANMLNNGYYRIYNCGQMVFVK